MGEGVRAGTETSGLKRRLYVELKNSRISRRKAREILLGDPYAGLEDIIRKEMRRSGRGRASRNVRVFK
jgi:hypothetical protein